MPKKIAGYIYRNMVPVSVFIICAYAMYLRIAHLYRHELWGDELYYLIPLKGTFIEFIKAIPKYEVCSYLSGDLFLFYPFFKVFSYDKWGLAIPCIIATAAGFYILYLICKMYFKSIWAYLITFTVVCFNATLINHATEIRTYAILPTIALAAFYIFQKMADSDFKLKAPGNIWAMIFFVLMIWFHVYGMLMYVSCLLFVLLSKCKEKDFGPCLRRAAFFTIIVLCFAMPLWLYSVFGPRLNIAEVKLNTFDWFPNPVHDLPGFLKSVLCNMAGSKILYILLPGIFIPFILSYKERFKQLLFLFFVIAAPVGFILLFDVMQSYWFAQRQFVWVMPLFAFFLGWAWDSFFAFLDNGRLKWKHKR